MSGIRDRWRLIGFASSGPWNTGQVFDLFAETDRLHLLYGVNGAGKTVTLRNLESHRASNGSGDEQGGVWSPSCIAVQVYQERVVAEVADDYDAEFDGDPLVDPLCAEIAECLALDGDLEDFGELPPITHLLGAYVRREFARLSATAARMGATGTSADVPARVETDERLVAVADEIAAQCIFFVSPDAISIAVIGDHTAPTLCDDLALVAQGWKACLDYEGDGDLGRDPKYQQLTTEYFERLTRESIVGPHGDVDFANEVIDYVREVATQVLTEGSARLALELFELPSLSVNPRGGEARNALNRIAVVGPAFEEYESATRSFLARAVSAPYSGNLKGEAFDEALALAQLRLEIAARDRLAELLPGAPVISLALPSPMRVLAEDYALWRVQDTGSIATQSFATQRLIALAVSLAIVDLSAETDTRVLLLDEPDLGLHRQAERRLFGALEDLAAQPGNIVVCATHSAVGLGLRSATLHHIYRSKEGKIERARMRAVNRQHLEELGLSPDDLLSLTRVVLLVEGRHDELVLRTLFGDGIGGLDDLGVHVVAMHGGRNAASVVDSGLLWDFTDARVAVVLDRVPHAALAPVWADAVRSLTAAGDPTAASEQFRTAVDAAVGQALPRNAKADELTWIKTLGSRALERGHPERLALLGLPADDVLAYLPTEALGSPTWQDAKRRGLTDDDVVRAVLALQAIPDDLLSLRDAIAFLAG